MSLTKYLDDAKRKTGSDYATAKALRLTRAAISRARKTGIMSDENIIELAKILDADPMPMVAACNLEKHPENEAFWSKWIAGSAIASAILALSAGVYLFDFYQDSSVFSSAGLYIMRTLPTVATIGLAATLCAIAASTMLHRSRTNMD